jgi:NADPH:quinone reductase-like Zn-dependent oxidoreductase
MLIKVCFVQQKIKCESDVLKETGDVSNLVQADVAAPSIKSDEVLVTVKATCINPADAFLRANAEFQKIVLGVSAEDDLVILGWDISGVVFLPSRHRRTNHKLL